MHHRAMRYGALGYTIMTILVSLDFDRHFNRIRQALFSFISETSRRFLSIPEESVDAMEEAMLI
ncbi:MAG: hypothetical protein LKF48_10980 [Prevotella sp.]|jgi:hypothetical protein|nr:hypothetical protein [Prevotella sp.]MCH4183661.1 hypothetical protein [Prevotella sp.]MCI1742216.1 hypothetical protein [Prevotella sp.]